MASSTLQGIGASAGIAIGPVYRYTQQQITVPQRHVEDLANERQRLKAALAQAKQEIEALAEQARQSAGKSEAEIFEAHALLLEDPDLLQYVDETLEKQQINVEYAWQQGTSHYADELRAIPDEYLSARAADVEDVATRVLRILLGVSSGATRLEKPVVIVAEDLAPSDTMALDKAKVLAFCTARGGPTAHVAIISKALNIPAVVGLGDALSEVTNETPVIVDGAAGTLLISPDAAMIERYRRQAETLKSQRDAAFTQAQQSAITQDGRRVEVVANIGSLADAQTALEYGAEGVGLLRTEFLFLDRAQAPSEDEQFTIYRAILEKMGTRPVVVRTLDIGGDKLASYLTLPAEMNPFLGIRGARLTLAQPELFQTQLRALLRAGEGHNLKLMFPMIASIEELRAAREQLRQAQAALDARRTSYAREIEVGIMIEVPSAALTADTLAREVDFFSIGTNDLSQYTLAADRTNAAVAALADALHPAVLRLIRMTIEAGHAHGRWVGVCGELAGEPLAAPVLLGMGLDEFSMNPSAVPLVKQKLRGYDLPRARAIMEHALSLGSAAEVRAYLQSEEEGGEQTR